MSTQLCEPVFWTLCETQEAWQVWAALLQALLAGAAIWFAARLAVSQERRAVSRRTDVFLKRIEQAALIASQIKTFFLGNPGEESRESVYSKQAKIFEMFAQSLRAVPLENIVDARLLGPLHNAALACENVVDLLRKPPPKTLEENQTWAKALGKAQYALSESHRSAFIVAAEFTSVSLSKRAMRWIRYLRMTIARKFAALQE
ncbi:hypothetical protein [Xanthomonas phaseoli]|uniref:DUF4760 domain-containing protein n=1 Tax=Xanthomonas manihotis TaxID=43353 RepID=A0A8I1XR69_XANMN|nr:hypothetical protein [Xanthomonas phaseoli]RWU13242.1 hypothetical protein XANMN_22475 [Xanthomonas phaseoli pv. manihotis str. CIO151]KUF35879.1 hypothetical protein AO826_20085 [Xanthomonas phaseoli pv. manihotis]MBO9722658.1 hypothetical protein [Xanthomonas phaseoli pv. manihotis]MBO9761747.1 hypothetical protein [Xanthomonas phaseoli pv. manihotis]MBO9785806.1 hypothetical protein [Xanthomonas phaseoli pv. manihotis]